MKDKDIISKGPKKRDPTCFQVLEDIVIPKGTILRRDHSPGRPFSCAVAHGAFSVSEDVAAQIPSTYKRVIA